MPDDGPSEQRVWNRSQAEDSRRTDNNDSGPSRRTSSTTSSRSRRRSPSLSRGSKTPLTPEESPPFRTTRKRNAGIVEEEDKELNSGSATPAHARENSGNSSIHVCICQPDPKIPRPRNAFILYRQHHQAQVVAQNPGLANPEISKIIGEQWQNQAPDVKNKWKALAEEEKLRHQQQYPTYRYQPKRNGRRNSLTADPLTGEKTKCNKCGGRTILAPNTPFSGASSLGPSPTHAPLTPSSSAITPVSRTLPVLRDLNLHSPAAHRMGRQQSQSTMSPRHSGHYDERDDVGPLSPGAKRRRVNGDRPQPLAHPVPPRYGAGPQTGPVGPGTPFPFGPAPSSHPYPPAIVRRESLPGLRGMVSPPGPMAPPPRPGPGYQQHRMSQGHLQHDRSLTLPPLQTGSVSGPSGAAAIAGSGKTAEEQIMSMAFQYKVKVLGQVAPPAPKDGTPRGPLVAIEGDSAAAVAGLGKWLHDELRKGDDLSVRLFDGPDVSANSEDKPMRQCHLLAAEWLAKSDEIVSAISYKPVDTPTDTTMSDSLLTKEPAQSHRDIDENYDDGEDGSNKDIKTSEPHAPPRPPKTPTIDRMDLDKTSFTPHTKPVGIIANFSLHASNVFACRIPIGPHDPYSPSDHWQWTATQWRGVIGPDLTIFVRDAAVGETGKPTVEMSAEGTLFVVKRVSGEGGELEASTLRRLGFEVSEWVRAFGTEKRGSA
ncbi:high-mobility group non-histone chromatin protein [Teratosphaeria destructans]|uniref:High-mobility group non-histone chromatin protein n=1 Tax=Teratosphaeria destructans TaxID=418781 RepID=A0A9W7SQW1_9PEZI|nr:high-mobility group non-histone chromatin protein [Teratosphaeria destructans]